MSKKPSRPRRSGGKSRVEAGLKAVALWVSPEEHEAIRQAAFARRLSMSAFAREIVVREAMGGEQPSRIAGKNSEKKSESAKLSGV